MSLPIAVQSYTIREFTQTEAMFVDSIKKISDIGYTAIQLSAIGAMNGDNPAVSAQKARRVLDDYGIRCVATHRGWDDLVNRTQQEIEFHQALGSSYVAIGSLPGSYSKDGLDGVRRWLADAEPLIARLRDAGIAFGYHNHAFEFEALGPDRHTFYGLLVDSSPSLKLELDVYWAAFAGVNPERLVESLAGRLPVVHVKDMEVADGAPVMAPIGEGNLDWPHLLPALKAAGTEWFCVEQDICRRDPFDCLKSSFDYLSEMMPLS